MDHAHAVVGDETELVFVGYAAFLDPLKESAKAALATGSRSKISGILIGPETRCIAAPNT